MRPVPSHTPVPRTAWVGLLALSVIAAACSRSGVHASTSGGPTASLLPTSPTELPELDPSQFGQLLVQLRGKPVVINVWASWCGPCIEEAPGLASAAREFDGRVQFVGVDVLDRLEPARAFIQKYGWIYPSVFDPAGAIRDDLGLLGQPVTIVMDATGKQVFARSGPIPLEVLRKELSDLV